MSLDINNDEFWRAHMVKQTQIEDWHKNLAKCGCGRVGRYETPTGLACNKYMRCDNAEFMAEQIKQLTAERDAYKEEWNGGLLTTPRSAIETENVRLRAALEKLACLGNGDAYGNSIGNYIAQEALKGLT